ncbi:hypothetical protein KA005_61130 [bacterium]|nr:hypothetical protein [bacterium]
MLARPIITQVAGELNDPSFITWTEADHIANFNSARRQVILVRPDAFSSLESVLLTPGENTHNLPADSLRLLKVTRNMGADGATAGRAIRMVDMESLNTFDRDWPKASKGKTVIRETAYDDRFPTVFNTEPPAHATTAVYIEVGVSKLPTDMADPDADSLEIRDTYEQPMRQYMLHLAFAVETESQASMAKSRSFLQDFYNSLGIKTKVDKGYTPSKD